VSTPPSRVAVAACLLAVVVTSSGCRGADPYYRHGVLPDAAAGDDTAANAPADDARQPVADAFSCPTCAVSVRYTCLTSDPLQASFVLDVTNQSNGSIDLADLTMRYWYTLSPHRDQVLDCDFARLGCANIVTSANPPSAPQPRFEDVMPPRHGANEYVEVAFMRGALALDPTFDTGEIQLRLRNQDRSPINQLDDYSFDCQTAGGAFFSSAITAYVRGVLVWGFEPR
jgi:hypothetical protein